MPKQKNTILILVLLFLVCLPAIALGQIPSDSCGPGDDFLQAPPVSGKGCSSVDVSTLIVPYEDGTYDDLLVQTIRLAFQDDPAIREQGYHGLIFWDIKIVNNRARMIYQMTNRSKDPKQWQTQEFLFGIEMVEENGKWTEADRIMKPLLTIAEYQVLKAWMDSLGQDIE